jgi:hypothetical protein
MIGDRPIKTAFGQYFAIIYLICLDNFLAVFSRESFPSVDIMSSGTDSALGASPNCPLIASFSA